MTWFLIGLSSQLTFAVLRTINVQHIAKNNLWLSLISGAAVSILWVVSTKVGIDALNDHAAGFAGYIVGAMLGIIIAMRWKQIINFLTDKWKQSAK